MSPNFLIKLAAKELYAQLEPNGNWTTVIQKAERGDTDALATQGRFVRAARKSLGVFKTHQEVAVMAEANLTPEEHARVKAAIQGSILDTT